MQDLMLHALFLWKTGYFIIIFDFALLATQNEASVNM